MKNIVLYHSSTFEGNSTETRPLGGTESGEIYMMRELSKLGYKTTVLCNCENEGIINGVNFVNLSKTKDKLNENIDIFISQTYPKIFLEHSINAKLKIFWTGANHDVRILQQLKDPSIQEKVDKFFLLSNWQANGFMKKFGINKDKIYMTRNGHEPSVFQDNIKRNKYRLIYFSSPSRGLDVLLNVFPKIRKKHPQTELHIYSGYEFYGKEKGTAQKEHPEIFKIIDQPGVFSHGNIKRDELTKEIQRSYIFAYPAHFRETSCMAAIESQAAGTVPVTSTLAALSETVQDKKTGILINGNSRSWIYKRKFVKTISDLFNNGDKWKDLSEAGRKRMAETYKWSDIAKEWDGFFKNALKN